MIAELALGRKRAVRGFMRTWWLVTLLLSACAVRVPRGIPVRISGTVRADVRVQSQAHVSVDTVAVPLQGARVTEFFGIPLEDAHDVLFVLDVSGSMAENASGQLAMIAPLPAPPSSEPPPAVDAGAAPPPTTDVAQPSVVQPQPQAQPQVRVSTKLEVAQAELIDAVVKLPVGTRINIFIFSNAVDAYAPSSVILDETNRTDLIAFVRDMRADAATALQPAMRMAFLSNAPRIVLLSDGLGNIGGDRDDIMRDVREAILGGMRIDAIGIGPSQDTKLLTMLAKETGGLYQRF